MNRAIILGFLLCFGACVQQNEDESLFQLIKSDENTLEIIYRGEGEAVEFYMLEGLHQTLSKNDQGTFKGKLTIQDLDNGIFSYYFVVKRKDQTGRMVEHKIKPNQDGEDQFYLWVGKKRTLPLKQPSGLVGNLNTRDFYSPSLSANRQLTIYSPKGEKSNIPIIYLTDGQVVEYYAPYIDKLISEDIILPIKLVGVHSSKMVRYAEYVNHGRGELEFTKHNSFLLKEVLEDIESNIKEWAGKRYIYGFSNGAAFCMYAGINYPDVFEEVVAFSTGGYKAGYNDQNEFEHQSYPKFYLGEGKYENFKDNQISISALINNNIEVEFKEFSSGHDYNVWRIEFIEYLKNRFGT
jgi:enterochelin esterase-like enzyme